MTQKVLLILLAVLAISIGLYPGLYFLIDREFGLLSTKPDELLTNTVWNAGFYTHIILGGLALLIGWIQFFPKFRDNNRALHRRIGTLYTLTAIASSLAGIYIGFYATGGIPSSLGFISLGCIWLATTIMAFVAIRNHNIKEHQKMMIYSYAACFAAVTLRMWLPLLVVIFGNFTTAYTIVAWLCWVPNLVFAFFISRRLETQKI